MPKLKIKRAKEKDMGIIALIRNCASKFFHDNVWVTPEMQDKFYLNYIFTGKYKIWIIWLNKIRIGYLQIRNIAINGIKTGEVGIVLSGKYRGKGIGKIAMKRFFVILKRLGFQYIWLTVLKGNVPAQMLFVNSGFKIIDYGETFIKMEKEL